MAERRTSVFENGLIWFGAAVMGTIAAVFFPMTDITDFLDLIGSIFAPMIAIQIADFFLLKQDHSEKALNETFRASVSKKYF